MFDFMLFLYSRRVKGLRPPAGFAFVREEPNSEAHVKIQTISPNYTERQPNTNVAITEAYYHSFCYVFRELF